MTAPNTTGASAEIQRWHLWADCSGYNRSPYLVKEEDDDGDWVKHSDALAAIARAREEARREALEEAAQFCLQAPFGFYPSQIDLRVQFARLIRESATPTPQGETKEPRGLAGIPFVVDPAVPPGEAQFVDPVDGRVIGRITGASGGMEQP